jgi:hypothetical protein
MSIVEQELETPLPLEAPEAEADPKIITIPDPEGADILDWMQREVKTNRWTKGTLHKAGRNCTLGMLMKRCPKTT